MALLISRWRWASAAGPMGRQIVLRGSAIFLLLLAAALLPACDRQPLPAASESPANAPTLAATVLAAPPTPTESPTAMPTPAPFTPQGEPPTNTPLLTATHPAETPTVAAPDVTAIPQTPAPTPSATLDPTPTATTIPTPVPQITPTLTPTPDPDVSPTPTYWEVYNTIADDLLPRLHWSPSRDQMHRDAAWMLAEIYIGNRAIAEKLLRLRWMQFGGITEQEFLYLSTLHRIAMDNPTAITDHLPLDLDWALNPPDERHREAAAMLDDIWLTNRAIGDELAEWDWIADGITMKEFDQLSSLHIRITDTPIFMGNVSEHIVQHWRSHGYLDDLFSYVSHIALVSEIWAIRLLNTPWLTDGITQYESQVLGRTISKSPFNADLADRMFNLHWIVDGVTKYEGDAAESLADIYRSHPELGEIVFILPWVTDGASQDESIIFWGMQAMGYMEEPLAREFLNGTKSIVELPGDLPSFAMESMGQIGEFPENFQPIAETTWFADGLSRQDAAFITALQYLPWDLPDLYESILQDHYTQSATVALPYAGDTSIWAFSNAPFLPGDNLLGVVAEAARITEGFMGIQFPTTDIILLVIRDDAGDDAITTAWYRNSHIQIAQPGKGYIYDNRDLIRYMTANYYYNYSFAPDWLREGAAEFVVAYIKDRIGVQTLASRRAMPLSKGEGFLHQIYAVLGEEVVAAALRELYLLIPTRDSSLPGTEEEIYRVFLNNTPAELKDEFRDIYRRHHGRVYPE